MKQVMGEVQNAVGQATDDDVTQIDGNWDKLVGKIQEALRLQPRPEPSAEVTTSWRVIRSGQVLEQLVRRRARRASSADGSEFLGYFLMFLFTNPAGSVCSGSHGTQVAKAPSTQR